MLPEILTIKCRNRNDGYSPNTLQSYRRLCHDPYQNKKQQIFCQSNRNIHYICTNP